MSARSGARIRTSAHWPRVAVFRPLPGARVHVHGTRCLKLRAVHNVVPPTVVLDDRASHFEHRQQRQRAAKRRARNAPVAMATLSSSGGLLTLPFRISPTRLTDSISETSSVVMITSFVVRVWAEEMTFRDKTILDLVHTVATDSSLIALTVSNHPAGLSTPFVSAQLDYAAFVDSQVASVSLFPVATHPLATLSCLLEADHPAELAESAQLRSAPLSSAQLSSAPLSSAQPADPVGLARFTRSP